MATAAAVLGSNLVVVALAWDHPPEEGGIVTITFLMMISFVFFVNVLHYIMRAEYLITRLRMTENDEEANGKILKELSRISRGSRFMHVSGLVFTMIAFWVISYKYLVSIPDVGYHPIVIALPFILFILSWLPKFFGIEKEVSVKSGEPIMQLIIEIIFLLLICLDFLRVITIF
ncbi:MAG: hypothetical protein KGD67_01175 [Candidatus Lokiarchaeota archaeon]|nr:hypothetical protein [Candidatus Lokiarchaeota archaeon]